MYIGHQLSGLSSGEVDIGIEQDSSVFVNNGVTG